MEHSQKTISLTQLNINMYCGKCNYPQSTLNIIAYFLLQHYEGREMLTYIFWRTASWLVHHMQKLKSYSWKIISVRTGYCLATHYNILIIF